MATYKGFSSVNNNKQFRMVDFDLVKQDLVNHISIKKGEKLMNPNFGSIVWSLLYEPLTESVKEAITADLLAIAATDPRVSVDSIVVTEYEQGIMVEMDLTYLATSQTDKLYIPFAKFGDIAS